MMNIKIGNGYDVHKLVEGRKLILGGIEVEHTHGLLGHSDADVLIHAIIDSLVSPTLALDIGRIFPDTDNNYKDIDSKILLKKACLLIKDAGFRIINIDTTIIAEKPKLSPHLLKMRETLAAILAIDISDITIKATTTERLGFTGRKEGIAAISTALVARENRD